MHLGMVMCGDMVECFKTSNSYALFPTLHTLLIVSIGLSILDRICPILEFKRPELYKNPVSALRCLRPQKIAPTHTYSYHPLFVQIANT